MSTSTLISETTRPYDNNPFAEHGVSTTLVSRWWRSANGHDYPDIVVEAYHGDNYIGCAGHPACLWPLVRKFLNVG